MQIYWMSVPDQGLFTIRVIEASYEHVPKVTFYAMDITSAMLKIISRKSDKIIPILGLAENITKSIEYASKFIEVPKKFDAIFSILTLHHCLSVERVFESIKNALKSSGKAVIVDLCEHPFDEFREEIGDIYLGFNLSFIKEMAEKFFSSVHIERMPGIQCECSGRSAELFIDT